MTTSLPATEPHEKSPLEVWEFAGDDGSGILPERESSRWKEVRLPHVFRQSALPDNAAGWYRTTLAPDEAHRGSRFFLFLEGAATIKDVTINAKPAGQHKGAYTAAVFDLTDALTPGASNELVVRVSNRDGETRGMLARSGLYFINGGMYRKAWLVRTGPVFFFPESGSCGVFLTPRNITSSSADLESRAFVKNATAEPAEVELVTSVRDAEGKEVAAWRKRSTISAGKTVELVSSGEIKNPRLWDLKKPELYSVRSEIHTGGKLTDVVTERVGFRTLAFQDGRFLLNGREVAFHGVNKHAQDERSWNAISDSELRSEWGLMQAMGVNAVRLAHYPHARLEYDIADESGIAIWAENGFAGQTWLKPDAHHGDADPTPDGERQTREMVRQNWNHPSIFFWSCGNEAIVKTAARYAEVIRAENDPNRLVTYAMPPSPVAGCDFNAANTYEGWYYGGIADFRKGPPFISETGAGAWVSHHVPYGALDWKVDVFEPEEYTEMFTEFRLQMMCREQTAERPMFFWWTFREFYDRKFKANRNAKGLVTLGGAPKDLYYLFQTFLATEKPVVRLAGRNHFLRRFAPDNGIKAYSNQPELELIINGRSEGKQRNGDYRIPAAANARADNVFFWKARLDEGRNVVEVKDGSGHSDRMVVYQHSKGEARPHDPAAPIVHLTSSNPENPAFLIDRPVQPESPFYSEVDGSSDNTFAAVPAAIAGSSWIATKRLSDPVNRTDLSFEIPEGSKDVSLHVMHSTGYFPAINLQAPDTETIAAAKDLAAALEQAGFRKSEATPTWRNHQLRLAEAAIWTRSAKAGEHIEIPGFPLDYVVFVQRRP